MSDEMKTCPFCAEQIKTEAIKCRYCGSLVGETPQCPPAPDAAPAANPFRDEWYRLSPGRNLGGVCSGLARHFNISVSLLRLAFVLSVLLGFGSGILIYIILWIILPLRRE